MTLLYEEAGAKYEEAAPAGSFLFSAVPIGLFATAWLLFCSLSRQRRPLPKNLKFCHPVIADSSRQ